MVEDEYYPYYQFIEPTEEQEPTVQVSQKFLNEYNRVMAEFYALQEEMKKKYEQCS